MKRIAILALVMSAACARAAGPSAAMTLDDCLKIANGGHPALVAAQAGVLSATEAIGEAEAPFLPRLDAEAGFHRFQSRLFLPAGFSLPGHDLPKLLGPLDDWTGGVSAGYTLWDFGGRRAGLNTAKSRRVGAEADANTTRADVRLSVNSAFYGLAAALDLQGVAQKNLERTESHFRIVQARRQAGAVSQADELRMQAELASAQLQLLEATSRVRVATGQLNTTMGRSAETPLAISTAEIGVQAPSIGDITQLIQRAMANRPEIVSAEERTQAAREAVKSARAARTPRVNADGSFGWNDNVFLPETKEWRFGVSVNVPVFDAGALSHRVGRARADLAREQAAEDNRRLQIRQEVWSAAAEVDRAWSAIAANETNVKANEESLRVIKERYQAGSALITDLLDTQTSLTRAEASLAQARWTYLYSQAQFERAVGGAQ